jgi:hypothetical protein
MQGEVTVCEFRDRSMTARQAGELFAAEHWGRPRAIDGWDGCYFYLADGTVWYRCVATLDGWRVVRTDKPV